LFDGQEYHLVLQADGKAVYNTFPIRKGNKEAFSSSTYFADGYAQFTSSGGWTGWDQWGTMDRRDGDLQFYFTVVP